MPEEDWEMIPHKVLAELKDEVHALKERIAQPQLDKELVASISDLKSSIKQMQDVFQQALTKIGQEEEEELSLIKMIQELGKKLPDIEKQNEQIAKAMVAIAEMVDAMGKSMEGKTAAPVAPPVSTAPVAPQFQPRLVRPLPPRPFQTMPPPLSSPSIEESLSPGGMGGGVPGGSFGGIPPPPDFSPQGPLSPALGSTSLPTPGLPPLPGGGMRGMPPLPLGGMPTPPPPKKGLFSKFMKK